ncbi:hypothetical protein HQ584_07850 [Patescibacteria group bacterium]|nr:hypothetical protein [Patescibacteria group bacterium]
MDENQDAIKKFISSISTFFELRDGEEKIVKYVGAGLTPSCFDGGKTLCLRVKLEEDGEVKFWDRTSRKLAKQLEQYLVGDIISIKRTGKKGDTEYHIRKVEE